MNKIPIKKVKTSEDLKLEASKLNSYDFEKIRGAIKELEFILDNNVIGDQLIRNLDNLSKDIEAMKDRAIETYIRLLKQGQQIF